PGSSACLDRSRPAAARASYDSRTRVRVPPARRPPARSGWRRRGSWGRDDARGEPRPAGHGGGAERRRLFGPPARPRGGARIATFVFRLKAPRPNFADDMTDEEREIMGRHAGYWQPFIDRGQMVIFGPVLDGSGSWGLGVVEADDEEELRAFAAGDPAVTSGTTELEIGTLLAGFVRPG